MPLALESISFVMAIILAVIIAYHLGLFAPIKAIETKFVEAKVIRKIRKKRYRKIKYIIELRVPNTNPSTYQLEVPYHHYVNVGRIVQIKLFRINKKEWSVRLKNSFMGVEYEI